MEIPELFGPKGKGISKEVLVGFVVTLSAAYVTVR